MKENLLSIKINTSIQKLFNFTINPENTHKWIDFIEKEWIDGKIIKKGIIYKNSGKDLNINSYELINYEKSK